VGGTTPVKYFGMSVIADVAPGAALRSMVAKLMPVRMAAISQ
jgi:hypothetical protein